MFARTYRAPRRFVAALLACVTLFALLPTPTLADDGLAIGSSGVAAGGALRSGPGWEAPVASEVAPGAALTIADGPLAAADGSLWYQVSVGGQLGYLPTAAVSGAAGGAPPVAPISTTTETTEGAASAAPEMAAPAVAEPAAAPAPVATGTAYVVGTDGDGAACRSTAGYEGAVLGVFPEGSTVETAGGAVGEWQPVLCGGGVGYVNAAYVSWDASAIGAQTTEMAPADAVLTPEPVVAEPALAVTPEPVAAEPVVEPVVEETALEASAADQGARRGGGGGGASGQAIADFALGYVGYPYAYAGEGPNAFDCSGFTKYVVLQTLGMDITHDMFTQVGMGRSVGMGELQPGDLVFFQDTFRPGLSHAGVYVGGGQFVHAENESTGVKVSDINSDYYASRWYGGTRLV